MAEWNLRDEIAKIISEDVAEDICSESIADRIMDLLKSCETHVGEATDELIEDIIDVVRCTTYGDVDNSFSVDRQEARRELRELLTGSKAKTDG